MICCLEPQGQSFVTHRTEQGWLCHLAVWITSHTVWEYIAWATTLAVKVTLFHLYTVHHAIAGMTGAWNNWISTKMILYHEVSVIMYNNISGLKCIHPFDVGQLYWPPIQCIVTALGGLMKYWCLCVRTRKACLSLVRFWCLFVSKKVPSCDATKLNRAHCAGE